MHMSTDRIEKKVVLRAPRSRVWRAIADEKEFGAWFGVRLEGAFAPGKRLKGQITVPGYEHVTMDITVERVDPERLFSYRWHPYAVDPGVDYSAEPTTLVEFRLEDVAGGTELSVVESGFDRIPVARRAEAFRMNEGGWAEQMKNIERHVAA
ncbi:MAG TPA: SRPBCC family protein [Vicinamibacteria bacterium]